MKKSKIDYGAGNEKYGYINPKLSLKEIEEVKENRRQKWAYRDYLEGMEVPKKKHFWQL